MLNGRQLALQEVKNRLYLWISRASGFLIMALTLTQTPVHAGWVMLDAPYQSPGLRAVYIDPDTIHREGNIVTVSTLIDWNWMQGNRSPTRFYSTKIAKHFDCAEKLVRTLAATDFYGHMGTGEVIGSGHISESHWITIEPGTLNQGMWEAACRNG